MAAIALAFAAAPGGALAGISIGAQLVLGSVAAVVDSRFILPALFPPPDVKGPRLNDFKFGTVDEGEPKFEVYGRSARVPCQVIDRSEFIESQNTTSSNGKGGTGGNYVEFTYARHLQVAICYGPIGRVKKIWANTRVIYNEDPDFDVTSNEISGVASQVSNWANHGPGGFQPFNTYYLKMSAPVGGPDLSGARVGQNLSISNAGVANNGSWEVSDSGSNPDGSTFVKVRRADTIFTTATPFSSFTSPSATPTLFQDLETYDKKLMPEAPKFAVGSDGRMGTHDQPVDALFEALRGAGEVPAYRGRAVFRLKNLQLLNFGNTIPSFTALIEEDGERTIGEALELISQDALDAGEVSAPINDALEMYLVRGPMPVAQKLQPLMLAYEIMSWENEGVLRFIKRKDVETLELDSALLAAHEEGASAPRPIKVTDPADDPAQRVDVRFIDAARNYQQGMRPGVRQSISTGIVRTVDVPLAMTPNEAAALALRLVWLDDINGRRVSFQVPPSLIGYLHEAMRVTFTAQGRDWCVLVLGVDRAPLSGLLVANGVLEQPHIFEEIGGPLPLLGDSDEGATLGDGTQHRSAAALPLDFHLLDCAALSDEHSQAPGLYFAAALTSQNESFSGAVVYETTDAESETWQRVATLTTAATMGYSTDTLASGPVGVWDETSTVEVELTSGELESCTELQCLNGANRMMIAREIIGFRTATPTGENTYQLSGLLRGLRDTADQVGVHSDGDRAILLTGPGIYFHRLSIAAVGMTRYFKCASSGAVLDDIQAVAHDFQGETLKPFAPCDVQGSRDGSNNLTITWTRVTRANVRLLSTQACPLLEPEEGYVIEIIFDDEVVRTIETSATTASYSAANQITDGYSPGDPIAVRIYQTSDFLRRGRPASATV